MGIFPFLTSPDPEEAPYTLATCTEWAYDYANGCLEVIDGAMRLLTGLAALKVWIYKAAKSELARWPIYSTGYGSELHTLMGQSAASEDVLADAEYMLTETLLYSPYITSVSSVQAVAADDGGLLITASVDTVYGPFETEVAL